MKMPKKNRWSDYAPAQISNVIALSPAETPLKFTFGGQVERPQSIDFSFMKDRPQIASVFARAMRIEGERYARSTRRNIVYATRVFNEFIKRRRPDIRHTSAITYELLQEFAIWMIERRKVPERSAANRFSTLRMLLKAARSLYPDAFDPNLELPIYIFAGSAGRSARAVSEAVLQRLVDAAEKEVDATRRKYREGDVPEGIESLIPFMILIAVKTAINPESLYSMGRDCLKPHAIDTTAFYVEWTKRRSKAGVQRQLHYVDLRGKGVIELLQFLHIYTQPLVNQVPAFDQGMLFLYRCKYGGMRRTATSARRAEHVNRGLKKFCMRYELPNILMVQLRPSTATHYYQKCGGNLRKVQLLLGHAEISTTERYIGDALVQSLHNKSIRLAQDALVARVTTVIPKEAKQALIDLAGEMPPEQFEHIADGAYDTGLGKCRNPFNSPQPGQRKGRCCTLFLACLTCPNALFFLESLPRLIALRNHFLAEKRNMSRRAWGALYQEKLEIIERDIIGAFSKTQIAKAERLAMEITDMSVLTAKGVMK